MRLTFYGVRGSIPTPGAAYVRYGGNTACVHIELEDGTDIILDSGTGIRVLGERLIQKDTPINLLLSHNHWDHIQGFPFFTPIYQPGRPVYMFPTLHKKNVVLASLIDQMDGAHFPITPDQVPSNFNFITENPLELLSEKGFQIELIPMNHPGGSYGYKIRIDDKMICYYTDNEIDPPYAKTIELDELIEQCRQADVLIHDAQYIEDDMPLKHGWGHSLISQVTDLGQSANVKNLVYYHHDPERTDDDLDAQLDIVTKILKGNGSSVTPYFAHEGLRLTL